jgi:hypothetical protein
MPRPVIAFDRIGLALAQSVIIHATDLYGPDVSDEFERHVGPEAFNGSLNEHPAHVLNEFVDCRLADAPTKIGQWNIFPAEQVRPSPMEWLR